jgi:hypothetical protein
MADIPLEKKFPVLCEIVRAQHFAWHEAVRQLCPDTDLAQVVNRMWEITGEQTGRAYLKKLDRSKPLAAQVAGSIVWSSQCMGEDAKLEPTSSPGQDEAFVRHGDCPWFHWHKRLGLLSEDRPGCDLWFQKTVDLINAKLGTKLRVETREALPEGGSCCLRRIWVE